MQQLKDIQAFHDRNLFVVGADPATTSGWTGVPNFILENDKLSPGAKLTYAMLLKYAREQHECFPGQKRLGNDIGACDRSVRTWLRELEKQHLVKSKRRGQGRSNLYTVTLKAGFWPKKKER